MALDLRREPKFWLRRVEEEEEDSLRLIFWKKEKRARTKMSTIFIPSLKRKEKMRESLQANEVKKERGKEKEIHAARGERKRKSGSSGCICLF